MHSDNRSDPGGVCGGSAPALVMRDGRLVFSRSGRTLDEVVAALERGEPVDPAEERIALARIDRGE
ncbi:hypothetical protein [Capillimicrobium parvum]|uniref:Uncharacterized protein n=1 Tax=Capillimicrobium parvum TaxID=2884022 RepID=A0A9E6XYR1_9ACTN|nr:hypothetical protein [Capillimicrobium parvum]UGS36693.1 hypothetical protein DSM104329_03102 [Capillimicrobium parvum]